MNQLYYFKSRNRKTGEALFIWATDAGAARQQLRDRGIESYGFMLRCDHKHVAPPDGYATTGKGLAHEPVVRVDRGGGHAKAGKKWQRVDDLLDGGKNPG